MNWLPWIETASGRHYHFLSPQPDEIIIEDIALALANKCRFSGHTQFYSVAEHSICVAGRLPPHLRMAGLLHDAAEAYLGDIPSPLKAELPDYRAIEKVNEAAIEKRFSLCLADAERGSIKFADRQALYTEAHYLLPSKGKDWPMYAEGEWKVETEFEPRCLPPVFAYKMFMDVYKELMESGPKQMELFS